MFRSLTLLLFLSIVSSGCKDFTKNFGATLAETVSSFLGNNEQNWEQSFGSFQQIMNQKCMSCHQAGGPNPWRNGLTNSSSLSEWIDFAYDEDQRIVPGDSAASSIVVRMKLRLGQLGVMPPEGPVSAGEMAAVEIFINSLPEAKPDLNGGGEDPPPPPPAINQSPVVNAGPDKTGFTGQAIAVQGSASDDGLPNPPGLLSLSWVKQSGPGTVNIQNGNSTSPQLTFSDPGIYVIRFSANDSLLSQFDDMQVTVTNPPVNMPPTVSVGSDRTAVTNQDITLIGSSADDGLPNPPATLTHTWSQVGVPSSSVIIAQPNALTTQVRFTAAGIFNLRLTANDSLRTGSDDLQITVTNSVVNQPPAVNAGPDKAGLTQSPIQIQGSATDDGLPNPPGALTISWAKISGPGSFTSPTPNSANTSMTFSMAGNYVMRLTATDGALSSSDDVQVNVSDSGGGGTLPRMANVLAYWKMDEASWNGSQGEVIDSSNSGQFDASRFGNPQTEAAPISGRAGKFDNTDGSVDYLEASNLVNTASSYSLAAYVKPSELYNWPAFISQDGSPNGGAAQGSNFFLQINGNSRKFGFTLKKGAGTNELERLESTTTALNNGWYHLAAVFDVQNNRISLYVNGVREALVNGIPFTPWASTGKLALGRGKWDGNNVDYFKGSLDEVAIWNVALTDAEVAAVYSNNSATQNRAPSVSLGTDRTVVINQSLNIAGIISDDGLPNPPGTTTAQWIQVNGPGPANITSPQSINSNFVFPVAGTYVLRLSVSDSSLVGFDEIQVTATNPPTNNPPSVSAGPDKTGFANQPISVIGIKDDDGLPNPPANTTVVWSYRSGPAGYNIVTPNELATNLIMPNVGTYVFRITAYDGALSTFDEVQIIVNPPPTNTPPSVSLGSDRTGSTGSPIFVSGIVGDDGLPNPPGALTLQWTQMSGPAMVSPSSPTNANSSFTLPVEGFYEFKLEAYDGSLRGSDIIGITATTTVPPSSVGNPSSFEPRIIDRFGLNAWFNMRFGPTIQSTSEDIFLRRPALFGGMCDSNYSFKDFAKCERRDSTDGVVYRNGSNVPLASLGREGLRTRMCRTGALRRGTLEYAILQVTGASSIAGAGLGPNISPTQEQIRRAYHLYFSYREPPQEILTALLNLGNGAINPAITEIPSGYTDRRYEPWRYILLALCYAPDNQIP